MVYSKKYPSFWTGNNHTNENSDALFQNIPIEANTPEFLFVQRLFNKTVSEKDIKVFSAELVSRSFCEFSCDDGRRKML